MHAHLQSGVSYNPSFTAHQQTLNEALKVETTRLAEQKKIRAELPVKMNMRQKDQARLAELSVGLIDDGEEEDEESDDGNASDADGVSQPVRRPVVRAENRKTRQQLNKQKRHQE